MKYKTIHDGLNDVIRKPYYQSSVITDLFSINDTEYKGLKTFSFTDENGVVYEMEIDIRFNSELKNHTFDFSYEIFDKEDPYKQIKASNFYKLYNTVCYLHITTLIEILHKTSDIPLMFVKGIGGRDELGNRMGDYRKVDMAVRLLDRHYPIESIFKDSDNNTIVKLNKELFIKYL